MAGMQGRTAGLRTRFARFLLAAALIASVASPSAHAADRL